MSIFTHIKRIRQHTKEHNSKVEQKSEPHAPYKHTPTHAASDAIGSAPPSERKSDRSKIREENRKRSAIAAAHSHAQHVSRPGLSRVGSGLSSYYGSGQTTPSLPSPHTSHALFYGSEPGHSSPPSSIKGKEVDRSSYFDLADISPSSSKDGCLPFESLEDSFSSQDFLEISSTQAVPPVERPSTASGVPHRLHPSSRRSSDVSIAGSVFTGSRKVPGSATPSRDGGPPPSTRGFKNLPSASQVSQQGFGNYAESSSSPATPSGRGNTSRHSSLRLASSRRGSFASLPNLTPPSTRHRSSTPATPTRTVVVKNAEFTMLTPVTPRSPSLNFDIQPSDDITREAAAFFREPKTPESGRHESLAFFDPSVRKLDFGLPRCDRPTTPSLLRVEDIVNVFPEASSPPEAAPRPRSRRRQLSISKNGSNLLKKKRRWSGPKATAVVAGRANDFRSR